MVELWLARDKNKRLKLFKNKPYRDQMYAEWRQNDSMRLRSPRFKDLQWGNDPVKVTVALKEDGPLWLCRDGILGDERDHYMLCSSKPRRSGDSGYNEWDAWEYFTLDQELLPGIHMTYDDESVRADVELVAMPECKFDIYEPFIEKYERWANMTEQQVFEETGEPHIWRYWTHAKRGRLVIRLMEGGNKYMKVGDSCSGTTRAFNVGLPLVIEYPNGYYQSSFVLDIDWKNETFCTQGSKYTFHFLLT